MFVDHSDTRRGYPHKMTILLVLFDMSVFQTIALCHCEKIEY